MTADRTRDQEVVHIAASILVSINGIPLDDPLVHWLLTERDKPQPDPLAVNFGQEVIDVRAAADRAARKKGREKWGRGPKRALNVQEGDLQA